MLVEQVPSVHAISARLRELLQTARAIKQTDTIEPPLPAADLEAQARTLSALPDLQSADDGDEASSSSPFSAVEAAARNIFYELLAQHDISQSSFVNVWNLLDLLQICADCGQCEPSLALWLVEELLDAQTIDGCRRVFDYLESRREQLITKVFNKNKQMIVLRSCNELLRRLSRAEDAVFCGRVFIFLFQSFPLGDKSSVNLRGEFHVENKTTYDDIEKVSSADLMAVDQDENAAQTLEEAASGEDANPQPDVMDTKEDTADTKVDVPSMTKATSEKLKSEAKPEDEVISIELLYPIFWSLQDAFSNPPSLFDEAALSTFKHGLHLTMTKFKSVPKVVSTSVKRGSEANKDSPSLGKRKRTNQESTASDMSSAFNPKYLTSFDLFSLELSDLTFQRHILVQSLILIEFLLSLTPKAKARLTALKAQKSLSYAFTLGEEDEKWALSTRTAIANYIKEGPDGHFYYRMVDNILTRDKNWLRWKIESCPPITRDPLPTSDVKDARAGTAGRCRVKRLRPNPLGAIDLGFLQSSEAVSSADLAQARPSADELIRQARGVDLDIEFIIPVGEDLGKRGKELDGKEREIEGRLPPQLAEERAKYREEYSAHIREKAQFEAERASRTWRLLRGATRKRFSQLSQIDETKDVTALGDVSEETVTTENDKKTGEEQTEKEEDSETHAETGDVRDVSMGVADVEQPAREVSTAQEANGDDSTAQHASDDVAQPESTETAPMVEDTSNELPATNVLGEVSEPI